MTKSLTLTKSLRALGALALITPLLCILGCSDSSTSPQPVNVAGTWTGSIASPSDASCNVNVTVVFSQDGSDFTGEFTIPGQVTGTFQGSINGARISGVFSEITASGCTGSGDFSGTTSSSAMTVSVPVVTTTNPACLFCQLNTVTLSR